MWEAVIFGILICLLPLISYWLGGLLAHKIYKR